jgi:hypothetical protein
MAAHWQCPGREDMQVVFGFRGSERVSLHAALVSDVARVARLFTHP